MVYSIPEVELSTALERCQVERKRLLETRQMDWEDYYSTALNKQYNADLKLFLKQLDIQQAALASYESPNDKWKVACERRYLQYIQKTLEKLDNPIPIVQSAIEDDEEKTLLHIACAAADIPLVKVALIHNASVLHPSKTGLTALHYAVKAGSLELLELLISHIYARETINIISSTTSRKHELFTIDSSTYSLHHLAAAGGHTEILSELLTVAPEFLEKRKSGGYTPLHLAVIGGHIQCQELLLSLGANASALTSQNESTIHLALINPFNLESTIDRLVSSLKNSDNHTTCVFQTRRRTGGNTVLHDAIISGFTDTALMFLTSGDIAPSIIVDQYTSGGESALHLATTTQNIKVAEALLNSAAIDITDNTGKTPLMIACTKGCVPLIEMYIKAGADLRLQDNFGHTALHLAAAYCNSSEVIEKLLSSLGDSNASVSLIDALDKVLNTPLHLACMNRNAGAGTTLLRLGANYSRENSSRRNALYLSKKWDCPEITTEIRRVKDCESQPTILPKNLNVGLKMISKTRELREALQRGQKPGAKGRRHAVDFSAEKAIEKLMIQKSENQRVSSPSRKQSITPFMRRQMEKQMIEGKVLKYNCRRSKKKLAPIPKEAGGSTAGTTVGTPVQFPWYKTLPTQNKRLKQRILKPQMMV